MSDIKHFEFKDTDCIIETLHDIKTPIYAQIRAMNLLYSGLCGEFSKEAKNIMLNVIASNKYMQCVVENFLYSYKMHSQEHRLNIKENDFRKTLEEVLCSIGILSEAGEQKIVVNYGADNFIKLYDEIEIQRVMTNILSNAFKYSKENSSIKIFITNEAKGLVFKVENEILPCFVSNLELDRNKKYSLNLGVLICEKIINAHKGTFLKGVIENGIYKTGFILP